MRFLFLSFLLLFTLQARTLKSHYTFTSPVLHASFFYDDINSSKDFVVVRIASNLFHFRIAKQRLINAFEKHNITIKDDPLGVVHFRKALDINTTVIEQKVAQFYQEKLPFLHIKEVLITPKTEINVLPKHFTVELKPQSYKRNSGTLKLLSDDTRLFFDYEVVANYSQCIATQTLRSGTKLTHENTKMKIVPFSQYYTPLLSFDKIGSVRTSRYIRAQKPLTVRDVEAIPLVNKYDIVNVKVTEGNIALTLTATALEDGYLDDRIDIKRDDGTTLKAKVVAKDKVEIE